MFNTWQKTLDTAQFLEKSGDHLKAAKIYSDALVQAKTIFQEHPECLIKTLEMYIRVCEIEKQYDLIENTCLEILNYIKSQGSDFLTFSEQVVKTLYAFYLSRSEYDKLDALTGADQIPADTNQSNQDACIDYPKRYLRLSKLKTKNHSSSLTLHTPYGNSGAQNDKSTGCEKIHASPKDGSERLSQPNKQTSIASDDITCTVYSESSASVGKSIFLQVFAHLPGKTQEATLMASMFDEDASMRGTTNLSSHVKRGTVLCFHLKADGSVQIDEVTKCLKWRGETDSVQFRLSFPDDYPIGSFVGKIIITLESIPIGHILFKLKVLESNRTALKKAMAVCSKLITSFSKPRTEKSVMKTKLQEEMKRYKYAFISYASSDRGEVLKRVQMLGLVGIKYFQDILSLDPGVRWEKELYKHIELSDVFLLFWSSAAKNSKWVSKEIKHAISCQESTQNGVPEIIPVILEGPPVPEPPPMLSQIHFNDSMIYFIND